MDRDVLGESSLQISGKSDKNAAPAMPPDVCINADLIQLEQAKTRIQEAEARTREAEVKTLQLQIQLAQVIGTVNNAGSTRRPSSSFSDLKHVLRFLPTFSDEDPDIYFAAF